MLNFINKRGPKRRSLERRFWAKVKKTSDCWLWVGSLDKDGYGQIMVRREDDTVTMGKAHRVVLKLAGVEVPDGKLVCHRCDNRVCVRPSHLFIGTMKENAVDMTEKGRSTYGERNPQAKLTRKQVLRIRKSRARGATLRVLADKYDVAESCISRVATGKHWRHV